MSTGGLPQFVLKRVELLKDYYNILVVEYNLLAWSYVVQRNKVRDILGDNFISLGENKEYEIINILNDFSPDIVFLEEIPETFMPRHVIRRIYKQKRNYKIFECTHSSNSKKEVKRFFPDKFLFVSPHSCIEFKDMDIPFELIEYPIDYKKPQKEINQEKLGLDSKYKHVVNIGLFTPGKNQKYAFEIARLLQKYKIQFHFVGNQAINFQDYWGPIMENKPENCHIWGERLDIDTFIQSSDLHLFTSNFELNPLAIKESLEYRIPTMFYNLSTYHNKYDDDENVTFLTGNLLEDTINLLKLLNVDYSISKTT